MEEICQRGEMCERRAEADAAAAETSSSSSHPTRPGAVFLDDFLMLCNDQSENLSTGQLTQRALIQLIRSWKAASSGISTEMLPHLGGPCHACDFGTWQ